VASATHEGLGGGAQVTGPEGRFTRRRLLEAAALGALGAGLSACGSGAAAASRSAVDARLPRRVLVTVAHADDDLAFMNPDVYSLVRAGASLRVVYLTTGDAGLGSAYWHLREEGAKAATAEMAGVTNRWTRSSLGANGRSLVLDTLVGAPRVSIVFMRLPDGNVDGSGWPDAHFQSLMKLWQGTIPTIASADGVTYTKDQLVATIAALMRAFVPDTVYTQDFLGTYGDGDHSDHITTGYLTQRAARAVPGLSPLVLGYQGYPVHLLPPNVTGSLLVAKERAFEAYSKYDSHGCRPLAECFTPGFFADTYGSWLRRQYVVAKIPAGSSVVRPVAT
jgi:LmbE family N-acetylglucosaminyl deacetylase